MHKQPTNIGEIIMMYGQNLFNQQSPNFQVPIGVIGGTSASNQQEFTEQPFMYALFHAEARINALSASLCEWIDKNVAKQYNTKPLIKIEDRADNQKFVQIKSVVEVSSVEIKKKEILSPKAAMELLCNCEYVVSAMEQLKSQIFVNLAKTNPEVQLRTYCSPQQTYRISKQDGLFGGQYFCILTTGETAKAKKAICSRIMRELPEYELIQGYSESIPSTICVNIKDDNLLLESNLDILMEKSDRQNCSNIIDELKKKLDNKKTDA